MHPRRIPPLLGSVDGHAFAASIWFGAGRADAWHPTFLSQPLVAELVKRKVKGPYLIPVAKS